MRDLGRHGSVSGPVWVARLCSFSRWVAGHLPLDKSRARWKDVCTALRFWMSVAVFWQLALGKLIENSPHWSPHRKVRRAHNLQAEQAGMLFPWSKRACSMSHCNASRLGCEPSPFVIQNLHIYVCKNMYSRHPPSASICTTRTRYIHNHDITPPSTHWRGHWRGPTRRGFWPKIWLTYVNACRGISNYILLLTTIVTFYYWLLLQITTTNY